MDSRRNPYAPGAGTQPPELAGRDDLLERADVALDRIKAGRAARSIVLYGLRGVGKTVLLNRIRQIADDKGFATVPIEAPEGRSLPNLLAPALRSVLLQLDAGEAMKTGLRRALSAVVGLLASIKLSHGDLSVAIDVAPQRGLADSGELSHDLRDVIVSVGIAAREYDKPILLVIDELQYVPEPELAALIGALHHASQDQLPVTMFGAGLPQILGNAGRAKSYAERLFEFVHVDRLTDEASRTALCVPANKENVVFDDDAVTEIIRQTHGYPYFIQEWGKHSWKSASASPIRKPDAERATVTALAELDASFFRVRFDRLTQSEKRYLRAMAVLGPGIHRSGEIAEKLGRSVTTVAPVRSSLIAKGMIYSPAHGDTAFTVPLFDDFMKRTMPES